MYGLVLEGGGAKGAYHVGAYKALTELGVDIGGIAGTSIGALNGAALVQGSVKELEDMWLNTKASDLFCIDEKTIDDLRNFKIEEINLMHLINISKEILSNRGLDISKINKLINEFIDEDKIRKSKLDFGIVTINLTDKAYMELLKEEIPEGKLVDYLLASANFPAFKQEERDGKMFLDGGLHDNLPIGVLMKKGYTDFIAVRTYGIGRIKKYDGKKINIIYVQPVESLSGTLDFTRENAEKDMKLGYYDTMKVFKNLRGYKYYCESYNGSFSKFLLEFLKDNDDKIVRMGKILGFEGIPTERMFFEKIMPRLEGILEMKGNCDYQDIVIRLVEEIASKYEDIEKFKIYRAEDFIKNVIKKFKEKPIEHDKNIPAFIKKNRLFSLAVKDNIIIEIFKAMLV